MGTRDNQRIVALAQENERLKREEKNDADTIKAHAARIRELEAERDAIRAKTIEDAKRAIVGVRFGAPSNWGSDRPHGWHLDRPCAPEEAAMHDNGCNDAFAAVSALAHSESETIVSGWQPISTRPDQDDPMWFAKWDGGAWMVDGPRGAKYDDADYFDYWAPCDTPPLPCALAHSESEGKEES